MFLCPSCPSFSREIKIFRAFPFGAEHNWKQGVCIRLPSISDDFTTTLSFSLSLSLSLSQVVAREFPSFMTLLFVQMDEGTFTGISRYPISKLNKTASPHEEITRYRVSFASSVIKKKKKRRRKEKGDSRHFRSIVRSVAKSRMKQQFSGPSGAILPPGWSSPSLLSSHEPLLSPIGSSMAFHSIYVSIDLLGSESRVLEASLGGAKSRVKEKLITIV